MSKAQRNLDGVFFRVKRNRRWCNVCYSDMTPDERESVIYDRMGDKPLAEQVGYYRALGRAYGRPALRHGRAVGGGVRMTATEELCRMLDERGVEWDSIGADVSWFDARGWTVDANGNTRGGELLCVTAYMTPEQAIAATIDTGTCEADETETIKCWVKCKDEPSTEHMDLIHVMECTECGHTYEHVNGDYEYCPRCGRKRRDFVE